MDVLYVINPYVSTLRKRKELQTSKIIKLPYVVTFVVLLCTFLLWFHCEKYVPKQYCDFDKDVDKVYRKIFEKRVRNIIVTASSKQNVNVQFSVGHGRRIVDLCPEIPDGLRQNTTTDVASIANKDGVAPGGSWYPSDCVARHRVAVIVPYRDRRQHLEILLRSLIPTLQQQSIHFRIYVVEQHGMQTFNKGVLMNSGFVEALADETWDCFVFHDVDLVAETNLPMYTCPPNPRHLSVAIDEMKYKLKYDHLVGGVFIIRREHFLTINGYSNEYWGWGSEDDDLAKRLRAAGLRLERPPYSISRYRMIKHKKRQHAPWKTRFGQLYLAHLRFHKDGLNSLKYDLVSRTLTAKYTRLMIDVGSPPIRAPTMGEMYTRAIEDNRVEHKNCDRKKHGTDKKDTHL